MAEKMPSEAECKRGAALMNRLIPEVFEFASRKRLSNRSFAEYTSLAEVWETYPDGWEENVLGMLSLAAVCGSSRHCAGFVRSIRDRLPDDEVEVARGWHALPWVWCAFEVVEVISGSLVEVTPIGERPSNWPRNADWDRLSVYSPTVALSYQRGITLHLAQLAPVHGVFHTYGVILPFRSFEPLDLLAFADFARLKHQSERSIIAPLAGVAEHASRLSDIIAHDPLSFLRLIEFVEAPEVAGRSGTWRRNASVVLYRGGVEMSDPVFWKRALAGAFHEVHSSVFLADAGALYLDGGSPLYDPAAYLAFGDRRVFLSAANEEAYARGREALLPAVEMPVAAQVNCSIVVLVAAGRILDTVDELGFLQERLDAELSVAQPYEGGDLDEEVDAGLPTMEETQAIIDRIVHNHNEGIEQSDEEIAEELYVTPRIVGHVRSSLPFPEAFHGDEHLPAVDRMGLSSREFHELLSRPVPAVAGVIALRSVDELHVGGEELAGRLCDTEVMRFAVWLLDRIGRRDRIPATQAGYVKPSVLVQSWDAGVVASPLERARSRMPTLRDAPEDDPRLARLAEDLTPRSESGDPGFLRYRELLEHAGLLRLERRSFIVTDDARVELDNPFRLYHRLLVTMLSRFEWWSAGRRYGMQLGLRERAGFLLYALHTLCRESAFRPDPTDPYGWASTSALTRAYAGTLPALAAAIERAIDEDGYTVADQVEAEIYYSFVKAFGTPFGLLETRRPPGEDSEIRRYGFHSLVRPTGLFGRVFTVGGTDQ